MKDQTPNVYVSYYSQIRGELGRVVDLNSRIPLERITDDLWAIRCPVGLKVLKLDPPTDTTPARIILEVE